MSISSPGEMMTSSTDNIKKENYSGKEGLLNVIGQQDLLITEHSQ